MLNFLNETFKGKKTYTVAIIAILTAAITFFNGEATMMEAIELALGGGLGMFIRHAIKWEVAEVAAPAVVETPVDTAE